MAEAVKKAVRFWCTPCQKWVEPLRSSPNAPPMCPRCRSGRVRPPMRGEKVPE
jgi:hypothetical protein